MDIEHSIHPPMGPLYIAAPLVEENYDVKIIDMRTDKSWKEDLKGELKKNPICVGLSSMTGGQIFNGILVSNFTKENYDGPIVWGGVHPSLLPEQTIKSKLVDIVVRGEGEMTFLNLIKNLEKGKSLKEVKGISYKVKGKVFHNSEREVLDVNKLPEIPYKIIDIEKYLTAGFPNAKRHLPIYTSRGCPHRCAFCYNTVFNKKTWRAVRPEIVLERVSNLINDFKIDSVTVNDDNFFVDSRRVEKICNSMKKEGIDIIWQSGCRLDYINRFSKSFLKMLTSSGLYRLQLGAESGCQRILNLMKKDITVSQIIEANKKLRNVDVVPKYSFMAGFPTETRNEIYETVDLMVKLIGDNPKCQCNPISAYTPYPGTELYGLSIKDGFKPPQSLEKWGNFLLDWINSNIWIDKYERKHLEDISYMTAFIDGKSAKEILKKDNLIVNFGLEVYTEIARLKCKSHFFYSPEIGLMKKIINR